MKYITKLLIILLVVFAGCSKPQDNQGKLLEKAKKIHENVITIDTHDDISVSNFTAEKNYTQNLDNQVNIPKMEKGGLDVAFFVVYTGQGELNEEGYAKAYANADAKFKAIHRLTEEYAPDKIELALTSDDVRRIVKSGKKVAMIGVENAYPIGTDLSKVEEFYNRGARYLSVSHNGHSQLGDSNTGERDDVWLHHGLSELGKKVVAECNRLGIMLDLSHPSKETNMQILKLSKAPVIASHSSARALADVSRNLDDETLLAIKKNGGVVQTVAFASYVNPEKNAKHRAAEQKIVAEVAKEQGLKILEWGEIGELSDDERSEYFDKYTEVQALAQPRIEKEVNAVAPPVDVADFVDHIDYLVKLIGIDHVGISSDFDGGGGVYGWNDASETFNVTLELVKRGYTEEEIRKIWGGNLLRVLDEVQQVAAKIQAGQGEV